MTFWNTLRWASALSFMLIVLVCWLFAKQKVATDGGSSPHGRPAPVIVRE